MAQQIDHSKIVWDESSPQQLIDPGQVNWGEDKQANSFVTSAAGRFVKGLKDPIDGAAQALVHALPDGVVNAMNDGAKYLNELPVIGEATKAIGLTPAGPEQMDEQLRNDEQQYQQARKSSGQDGIDLARVAGNIVGTLPMANVLPSAGAGLAAKTIAGATNGAVFGATMPVTEGDYADQKKTQIGVGAMLGGTAPVVFQGLGKVISPAASKNQHVQTLIDAGVTPTPGQLMGGIEQRVEDKATSLPIVGDAITSARQRAVIDYNKAIFNRALAPIGVKVDQIGRDGVAAAQQAIEKAYDDIMPQIQFKADAQFANELGNIRAMIQHLPEGQAKAFDSVINSKLMQKMTPQGAADGLNYKQVTSEIGRLARTYMSDVDADKRQLGMALKEVQAAVRDNLVRARPQAAQRLATIDKAYSNFTRLQQAAGMSSDGIFTPAQFKSAVRAGDRTIRKGSYAKGGAILQDLADAGATVLNSKIPDSGTAGRLLGAGAGLGAGVYNPAIPASLVGASVPYLPGADAFMKALIAVRPKGAEAVAGRVANVPSALVPALMGDYHE